MCWYILGYFLRHPNHHCEDNRTKFMNLIPNTLSRSILLAASLILLTAASSPEILDSSGEELQTGSIETIEALAETNRQFRDAYENGDAVAMVRAARARELLLEHVLPKEDLKNIADYTQYQFAAALAAADKNSTLANQVSKVRLGILDNEILADFFDSRTSLKNSFASSIKSELDSSITAYGSNSEQKDTSNRFTIKTSKASIDAQDTTVVEFPVDKESGATVYVEEPIDSSIELLILNSSGNKICEQSLKQGLLCQWRQQQKDTVSIHIKNRGDTLAVVTLITNQPHVAEASPNQTSSANQTNFR